MANRKKKVYKPKPMTEGKETSSRGCSRSMISKPQKISRMP